MNFQGVQSNIIINQQNEIKELEGLIKMNKVFTYMVIHDLKHPTEATISTLKDIEEKLNFYYRE